MKLPELKKLLGRDGPAKPSDLTRTPPAKASDFERIPRTPAKASDLQYRKFTAADLRRSTSAPA
jgi:hypothetical protein